MKKWQYISIVGLVVVVLGLVTLARWLRPYDLATEQARARAAGLPLTAAEIGIPKPPPSQDAYPLWVAMQPYLRTTPREDALIETMDRNAGPYGRLNANGLAAGKQLAADTRDLAGRIREAASRPITYWPLTYTSGSVDLGIAASLREVAKYLAREGQWRAAEGRYAEAAESAGVGMRVSKAVAQAPTVINYLVAVAVDAIAVDSLDKTLHIAGPDEAAARAARSVLAQNPPAYNIGFALRGETVLHLNEMEAAVYLGSPYMWGAASPPSGVLGSVARIRPPSGPWHALSIRPSQAAELHWFTRMAGAAHEPFPARLNDLRRLAKEMDALSPRNPTYAPVRAYADVLPACTARGAEEDARRAVLLGAAEVMEYRATHGAWPSRLAEAAPKPPLDPFTGRPVLYERVADGFRVYSGVNPSELPTRASRRGLEFRYP